MFILSHRVSFFVAVIIVIKLASYGNGYKVGDNPFIRGASLDTRDRYNLEWTVHPRTNRITFNVTVQTKGWILFGLANNADERTGRDIVIGGVHPNGQGYLSDKHSGRYNEKLETDRSQDYTLLDSWESGTHTFLSFSRELETCDKHDYPITENKLTIIWAFGEHDNENGDNFGGGNKGSYDVYLLDPEFSPRVIRANLYNQVPRVTGRESPITQVWTVNKTTLIPHNDTSYMCSIRKAPRLERKHHVVGFDINFGDEISRAHTHHLVVYRCRAPQGIAPSTLFDSFAQSGQEENCFDILRLLTSGGLPVQYCQQNYMVWALGGRAYFTPDHVGFPFGEDPDEYYLFQVHYDNPQMRADITVNLQADFFYTRRLRPNDGGMMVLGHVIPGRPIASLIPPGTSRNRRFGHCPGECTERMLPKEGITMIAGMLHSHRSGRQIRMHHFRKNEELPWIIYDDNYNNGYQQVRALPRGEVQIYPGDQLTVDCIYDNTWTNGSVVGGFRTRDEMCVIFAIFYNALTDYSSCHSEVDATEFRPRYLNVLTNTTWRQTELDWVAAPPSPSHLVGRTLRDISDNVINWDVKTRRELAEVQEGFPHTGSCSRHISARDPREVERLLQLIQQLVAAAQDGETIIGNVTASVTGDDDYSGPVSYPSRAIPYTIPETSCLHRGYFPKRG